ncbi:retrovirus-related pol polyprotein from transposon TNT 1-94 [Tanacetum coccineum]
MKAKKESSDDKTSTSESDDEEYAMAVRNFKKFFRRKGKFVRQPREEKESSRQRDKKKGKSDRNCFRCGDPNHLIGDCPKPSRNEDQKAFIGDLLEKEILELNEKIKKLERSKEIEIACKSCEELKLENAKLKKTQVKFVKFDKSANSLREMLNNQKSPSCKIGLGFDSGKASTSGTKTMSFVGSSAEKAMDESTIKVHGSTLPGSVCLRTCLEPDEWIKDSGYSKHMTGNKSLFNTYKAYDGGNVVFGRNLKGKIIGSKLIYGGNLYTLVVVDDYSRYTWTRFLKTKNKAFDKFEILSREIQNQLSSSIIAIRMDHGREFDNEVQFGAYCDAQGITHNFSALRTQQSNGVVERKNKTLQEMYRTMLNEQTIPQKFWCNDVDTSTYILNRILILPILGKTPYEIFRGYSQNSKAYVVLNKHSLKVEESLNVTFDESPPPTKLSPLVDDDVGEEEAIKRIPK